MHEHIPRKGLPLPLLLPSAEAAAAAAAVEEEAGAAIALVGRSRSKSKSRSDAGHAQCRCRCDGGRGGCAVLLVPWLWPPGHCVRLVFWGMDVVGTEQCTSDERVMAVPSAPCSVGRKPSYAPHCAVDWERPIDRLDDWDAAAVGFGLWIDRSSAGAGVYLCWIARGCACRLWWCSLRRA